MKRLKHPLAMLAGAAAVAAISAWAIIQGPDIWRRYIHHELRAEVVARGLETPWALAFLGDGRLLVTERPGRLRVVEADGRVGPPIQGVPAVLATGEGGLLDVAVDPRFAENRLIYLAYSETRADAPVLAGVGPQDKPAGATAIARARLADDHLENLAVLYRQEVATRSGTHYGARLLFDDAGHLFVGLGDRGARDHAQDVSDGLGKILRLNAQGQAPGDNPFSTRAGAQARVWSYGHRNVQGLAWHPGTGALWASEHGPQGGDEINLVRPGANYGWPVVTHGCEYVTCAPIGEGTAKVGMVEPLAWFGPKSVPLTGMAFVTSARYPALKDHLLVGVLWGRSLIKVRTDGDRVAETTSLWLGGWSGVRDVRQGPDGWLYVTASSPEGAILRLRP